MASYGWLATAAAVVFIGCGSGDGQKQASSASSIASTGADPAVAALARLFRSPQADAAWFSQRFLQAVPLPKVQSVLDEVRGQLGEYRDTTIKGSNYVVAFSGGSVVAHVTLDEQGRFEGLLIDPPGKT